MGNFNSLIRSSAVATGGSRKTGIIRGISNDFCVVSVNIEGSLQSLSFEKTAFYFWGYPCEGDMTNLLDVGMEVNVRIRISASRKPKVVAAWIGDEPESINEALVAVFNEKGFVDGIIDDGAMVIFGENIGDFVIAKKGVIYRDRSLLDATAAPLSLDEPVTFDATPLQVEHHSGATYEATCAWTGAEPRLVDRFDLRVLESLDQQMLSVDMNRVQGIVVVIPNDVLAIAEVEETKEKVLVFRSSFGRGFESIHDVVGIGDRLCMHLASAYMFGGRRLSFATKACEVGEGIEVSQNVATLPGVPTQLEPKSAIRCASEGAPWKSPDTLEEREREISEDTNGVTVEDKIVKISSRPSAGEVDSRVVTNGLLTEHRIKSSASNIYPSKTRVDMNGPTVEMCVRSANTNGLSLEKQNGRADSNHSPADEGNGKAGRNDFSEEWDQRLQTNGSSVEGTDKRADTNGSLTTERDGSLQKNVSPEEPVTKAGTNGFSAESRDQHLGINGSTERCERVVTNGSSAETRDLKELPMSIDLAGTALCREPPLAGTIYTKTTLQQDEAVIRYDGRYIYVNICDVYVDGRPCSKDLFSSLVKPGDSVVNFEAVAYELSSGKMYFSHYATCVWVGEKPTLAVVASSIWDVNHSILRFGNRTYVGKVENFCFPDIALLSIEAGKGKLLSVVCLHLSELVQKQVKQSRKDSCPVRNCISDFVDFQGYVEFNVKRNDVCSLGLCAYNVKKSTKLAATKSSVLCANLLRELKCADSLSSKLCEESESQCAPTSQESDSFGLEVVRNVTTFTPSISLAQRSYFLNGVGTFCFDQESQVAKIEHIFGSSILESDEYQSFRDSGGLKFGFDAEIVQSSASNELCVKKVWKPDSLKSASDGILASELAQTKLASFDESQVYRFVIASIPFHDCAIAECGGTKVYVSLDSIVTSPKADPILCSIELFLAVGDHVGLKVKEERSIQTFFKASACYKLGEDIANMAVNQPSWRNFWGLGEYFKTGRVKEKKGTYCVDFVSTTIPGTEVSLQLSKVFDCGRLFVDGKPLSGSMSCLKDRDISFHVACHPVGSFFAPHIEWAWLGNYPLLPTLLKNRTAATCGLICQDWLYEGIVRDFPLPTYAICQVGFLSVLLPLTAEKRDGDIVGVVESHLKEGDRVILSIKEQFCVKQAILISSLCRSVATMFGEREVLINVLGKVIDLPRPRGTINVQGFPFDVWFDRSVVFAVNGVSKKDDIFEWIEYIDSSISIGTEVYFSAATDLTWDKYRTGYRVYEMRVVNAPGEVPTGVQ